MSAALLKTGPLIGRLHPFQTRRRSPCLAYVLAVTRCIVPRAVGHCWLTRATAAHPRVGCLALCHLTRPRSRPFAPPYPTTHALSPPCCRPSSYFYFASAPTSQSLHPFPLVHRGLLLLSQLSAKASWRPTASPRRSSVRRRVSSTTRRKTTPALRPLRRPPWPSLLAIRARHRAKRTKSTTRSRCSPPASGLAPCVCFWSVPAPGGVCGGHGGSWRAPRLLPFWRACCSCHHWPRLAFCGPHGLCTPCGVVGGMESAGRTVFIIVSRRRRGGGGRRGRTWTSC